MEEFIIMDLDYDVQKLYRSLDYYQMSKNKKDEIWYFRLIQICLPGICDQGGGTGG